MNQEQRLDYLVEQFKKDSVRYKNMTVGSDSEEKRTVLRSLMNIRMPGLMSEEIMEIQDAYLKERAAEKGVVTLEDIPSVAEAINSRVSHGEKISLWQGDITRLQVDAIVNAANSQMLGCFAPMHACIDNCIHTFAGIQLRNACDEYMKRMRQ
jgi:hypothetical protein